MVIAVRPPRYCCWQRAAAATRRAAQATRRRRSRAPTRAETSGTDTSSSSDTTDGDVDTSLAECAELTELSTKFTQALGSAATGSGAPDLEETAKAYEEFAEEVPEEIRDAFRTVAAAFTTYAEVLKDIDLSAGETPDPETLAEARGCSDGARRHRAHGRERGDRGLGDRELHHRAGSRLS